MKVFPVARAFTLRNTFFLLVSLVVAGFVTVSYIASSLSAPQIRSVGTPPPSLSAESVTITRADGGRVSGWFALGAKKRPGVLLLHGIRSDRRQMVGRGRFLHDAGYSVLLIDMQAHGETAGDNITFGYRESRDVHAAARFLRSRIDGHKIGVIGVSLGGAATLLGESPVAADAVVIESVYSSIDVAVKNRLRIRFGDLGTLLTPLLTLQIEPRLGIPLDALSPVDAIGRLEAPVMIIAGTKDRHTLQAESIELYERANLPKRLWLIEGAIHQDLHSYAGSEYEKRVLRFFRRQLEGLFAPDG